MAENTLKPVIIGFILQGRPYVMMDDDNVLGFVQFSDARDYLRAVQPVHVALKAADSIIITDLDTGESVGYL